MNKPAFRRRRFLRAGLAASATIAANAVPGLKSAVAADAAYPTRPIRVVIPASAGSALDIMTRLLAPRMSDSLGQQLIIDYRPGAQGVIANEVVVRSPPDGYTLVMGSVFSHSIAPAVRPTKLPYDVLGDFTPIGRASTSNNIIVVHPSVPARNLTELIAFSKTVAGGLNFCSGGTGSSNHLAGEMLRIRTGANLVHVAYKNVSQAIVETVGGHVPMMIYTVALLPHVREGRLRALAVVSEHRSKQAPEIPTAIEQGVSVVANSWFGLFGPARLPEPIRDRLFAVMLDALLAPEVSSKLIATGLEPAPLPPTEFRAFIERDIAMWKDVVEKSGVKID